MYINKEDYDIYFNGELIEDVVDIDVYEVLRLGDKGIGECQDILAVTFLGPEGILLRVRHSAEEFRFKKKSRVEVSTQDYPGCYFYAMAWSENGPRQKG